LVQRHPHNFRCSEQVCEFVFSHQERDGIDTRVDSHDAERQLMVTMKYSTLSLKGSTLT
jgi:hypothetical protein